MLFRNAKKEKGRIKKSKTKFKLVITAKSEKIKMPKKMMVLKKKLLLHQKKKLR